MGLNPVVDVFFQLASKWSKWCAQTLHPFFQIFNFFRAILAPIVAPPSENSENCSIGWKGLVFRKKLCKYHLNRPTNADAMSFGSNSTCIKAVGGRRALFSKKNIKSEKHHISSSRSDMRRAISTKFCMVIEVVRAIILGPIIFWVPSIVLPLGGVENLAENAPYEVNC